ncbi:membrane protein [Streptomycetaceae bacterium MP113-05]|nr:membrane protein [Streptomycetaceae bacterium MP113-05]
MIRSEWFFWLVGAAFLGMAVQMAYDRSNPKRWGTAAFWGLLGVCFVYSTWVEDGSAPAAPLGLAVLVMICLGGLGLTGRGVPRTTDEKQRTALAARFGNRLFVPALTIPLVAVACAVLVSEWSIGGTPVLEENSETILGLGLGSIAALGVGMWILRERRPSVPVHAGRGLLEAMGWALLLPQLLAVLGSIFSVAGVGDQVRRITEAVLPDGQLLAAVALYCVGMAAFTVIMGNAFAAFPVMTAAVGWPVLIQQMDGDPAAVLAVGMLAGFCGTLVTPMAANFNLVPAALLELKDQYGPIKVQAPTAAVMLCCNIAIIYFFAF